MVTLVPETFTIAPRSIRSSLPPVAVLPVIVHLAPLRQEARLAPTNVNGSAAVGGLLIVCETGGGDRRREELDDDPATISRLVIREC